MIFCARIDLGANQTVEKRPYSQFLSYRYWPTWLGLAILRLLSFLPLPVLTSFGHILGFLFYHLVGSRRKIALKNIETCFPELSDKECRRINRRHFQNSGQLVFTSGMHWWVSQKRFNRMVEIVNREHYDRALADGRNVILLTPHFVALAVAGMRLNQERPMITMYQYSKNTLMDEVTIRGRTRYGGLLVERKEPLRKLVKLMRQGHPFYYLPDQDAGRKGIFVPFFHELASTIPVLGKFTSMTDAVVIPCMNKIKPWGQGYEIALGSPLENFPVGDDYVDTARMNEIIASMVRENPEQYFWAHKRFKTRPEGDPAFYK
jgi:KDO2-lipid IV(A) lauroyltransferase